MYRTNPVINGVKDFIKEQLYPYLRSPPMVLISLYIVFFISMYEIEAISETGYINPKKQIEDRHIKKQKQKEELIKIREEQIRYNELSSILLNLADKDENGYLDFAEQVEMHIKAGYEGKPFIESRGDGQFPELKLKDLETAIAAYQK